MPFKFFKKYKPVLKKLLKIIDFILSIVVIIAIVVIATVMIYDQYLQVQLDTKLFAFNNFVEIIVENSAAPADIKKIILSRMKNPDYQLMVKGEIMKYAISQIEDYATHKVQIGLYKLKLEDFPDLWVPVDGTTAIKAAGKSLLVGFGITACVLVGNILFIGMLR